MLTAYVASTFCNVAILPGCAVTFNVAVNPTQTSIVVINDTVVMRSTLLLRISLFFIEKSTIKVILGVLFKAHVISHLAVNCTIEETFQECSRRCSSM